MRKSLIIKFLFYITTLIICAMGIATFSSYMGSKNVINSAITEQLIWLVDSTGEHINSWINDRKQDLVSWSTQQTYQTALEDSYLGRAARDSASLRLKEQLKNYPYYESFNLATPDGEVIASSDIHVVGKIKVDAQQFFRQSIKGEVYLTSIMKSPATQRNVLIISVPMQKNDLMNGVFFGIIDAEAFTDLFISPIKIGKTGYAYLVDAHGQAIAHPDKKNIYSINIGSYGWGQEILKKERGFLTYTWAGVEKIVFFKKQPKLGWIVGAGVGVKEIFLPIKKLRTINLLVTILIIVITITSIIFIYKYFIEKPMHCLMEGIAKLGQGQLDNKIELKTNDEFGELARAFNKMIDDLKKITVSRDELAKEIAERKKAETQLITIQKQLIQSEKMASIGQLAAGVAHEINNPTSFVMSNFNVLENYLADLQKIIKKYTELEDCIIREASGESARIVQELKLLKQNLNLPFILSDLPKLTKESYEGTRRIQKIVADLRSFSHSDEEQKILADIHEILEASLNIVRNEIKYKAELVQEYGQIPNILCYPQTLSQVFLNLLINAGQAIDKKGVITIKTYTKDGRVFVEISDTGCGMSEAVQAHLFEPFFTTKPVGKGTGLGLSLAYNIIKKHAGEIMVQSKEGYGTTFTIILPCETT